MKTTRMMAVGAALLAGASLVNGATAAPTLEGLVALDYYVAAVDDEGFESVAADFYVEEIANDSPSRAGPLALGGWLTAGASPAGDGFDVGALGVGTVPAHTSLLDVEGSVWAEDAPPGEYYPHVLLLDERFPDTWEDARSLAPRLLWRGGLEAVGPLHVDVDPYGEVVAVDFSELRNNRLDARYTNDIALTLYATHGFGPASAGHVLCRTVIPGLYAGDARYGTRLRCAIDALSDGEYTLHLEVAEQGGRGGSSTLSGPDIVVRDGFIDTGSAYVHVGAFGAWWLLPLLLARQLLRARAWRTIERIRAG